MRLSENSKSSTAVSSPPHHAFTTEWVFLTTFSARRCQWTARREEGSQSSPSDSNSGNMMLTWPWSSSSGNRENRLQRKNTREEKTTRNLCQLSGHRGQVKKEMESRKTARATIWTTACHFSHQKLVNSWFHLIEQKAKWNTLYLILHPTKQQSSFSYSQSEFSVSV